jgi:hypothetical protein
MLLLGYSGSTKGKVIPGFNSCLTSAEMSGQLHVSVVFTPEKQPLVLTELTQSGEI